MTETQTSRGPAVSLETIADELRAADKLVVATHLNPDGDAIGSARAMELTLLALGKDEEAAGCGSPREMLQRLALSPGGNTAPVTSIMTVVARCSRTESSIFSTMSLPRSLSTSPIRGSSSAMAGPCSRRRRRRGRASRRQATPRRRKSFSRAGRRRATTR